MTQCEKLISLYIRGWTSHHKATLNGAGGYPWKRWAEMTENVTYRIFIDDFSAAGFRFRGKNYREETRTREAKGVRYPERRLVLVK